MVSTSLLFAFLSLVLVGALDETVGIENGQVVESSGYEPLGQPADDSGFVSGPEAVAIDTDCSTKKTGLHAIAGCSPKFLTCAAGISRILDCPAGLIFDSRISACQWSYNIRQCSKRPQDVPFADQTDPVIAKDTPICTGEATAIEPCSQTFKYRNCVHGEEETFTCETGLFFSAETGACEPADQIEECQKNQKQ